jgi:hypothetical protein
MAAFRKVPHENDDRGKLQPHHFRPKMTSLKPPLENTQHRVPCEALQGSNGEFSSRTTVPYSIPFPKPGSSRCPSSDTPQLGPFKHDQPNPDIGEPPPGMKKAQFNKPSPVPKPLQRSMHKESNMSLSNKPQTAGFDAAKKDLQAKILAKSHGQIFDSTATRPHNSLDQRLGPAHTQHIQQSSSCMGATKISQHHGQQNPESRRFPNANQGDNLTSTGHGVKKHADKQPKSGQAPHAGASGSTVTGSGTGPAGTPSSDKGKGPAGSDNKKPLPLAWGFGRRQRKPPTSPVQDITLLELLSCRELELFQPHASETGKPLSRATITTSPDFSYEDVINNYQVWSDFTFQNMLTEFPFLNHNVEVPEELGTFNPAE